MTLHRFFVPPETVLSEDNTARNRVRVVGEQAYQIRRVLRLRPGHQIVLLTGDLREWIVRLTEVGPDSVTAAVEDERRSIAEPRLALSLYQGILKGPKFEMIVQRCTEVGVSAFAQIQTERSVPAERGESRARRYRSIIREAAEQSERGKLPELENASVPFEEALRHACAGSVVIVLWEEEHSLRLRDIPDVGRSDSIGLFVGPEGGLSPHEVELARAAGAHIVTLGPRVLRSETAAIVGSALLLAQTGDLG